MKYIRRIILSLLLVAIWFTMRSPGAGEAYARNIYPYVSAVLSRFSSLFPFSVGDCLIYGSIVGLLVYVGCAIAGKCSWKTLAGRTVEYLLWVYVWFYMAWGLNYFRQDFFTRTQLPYAAYSADAFRSFLSAYTDALNASFVPVEEVDKAVVAKESERGYREIAGRFGLVAPAGYLHPKPMLFSSLMSGVGVLGYMGPFFTEYNLNPELLPVYLCARNGACVGDIQRGGSESVRFSGLFPLGSAGNPFFSLLRLVAICAEQRISAPAGGRIYPVEKHDLSRNKRALQP